MKIATGEMMSSIDKYTIENLKIPSIVLMENAALKVLKNIELDKYNRFVVVCGKGNNGGDGLALARHLHILGKKVEVFVVGLGSSFSGDCRINYDILKNMGLTINKVSNMEDVSELRDSLSRSDVTIDAIFGTGINKKIEDIYDQTISIINENSSYIIAIDIPSGLDTNSGRIWGNCVKADKTITFQLYKRGFLNYGADKYTGRVIVEHIGIPEAVIDKFHENEFIMDRSMIKNNILARDKYSHKGDYGRVLIAAGSNGFTGAAYIAAEGAVRSGAGLVTLCCSKDIKEILSAKLIEAMTVSFDERERIDALIERCNAIAFGPGMGDNENTFKLLKYFIEKSNCPMIIDADGINVLKDNLDILKKKNNDIIITPHVGEMSKLTGLSIEYIQENRIEAAKNFAREHGIIVLLKGYNTVITDGKITIINPTGNSSMASGGMGDCLTGMVVSFVGQGYSLMHAASLATFIHGYCGEVLSKKMFCVNATHVLETIPFIIKELQDQ